MAKSTTVHLSQLANFPDQGVNQTIAGSAPVDVSVDLEMSFGVEQTAALSDANRGDLFSIPFGALTLTVNGTAALLRQAQTGYLRWYIAAIAAGAILAVYLVAYS